MRRGLNAALLALPCAVSALLGWGMEPRIVESIESDVMSGGVEGLQAGFRE